LLVDASPQGSPEVEEGEDGLGRQVVLVEHVQRHGGVTATQRHDETMLDEPLERARGGGLGYAARPRDRAAAQWADRVRQRPDDGCVDVGDGDRVRTEEVHGAILADPAHPRSAWTGPGPRLGPCPRVGPCPRPGPCRGRTPVPAWAPRRAPAAGPYTRCGAVDRSWTGRTKIGPLPLEGSCLLVRGCPRWTRGARAARPSAPVEDDLARPARAHDVERLLELLHREAVGDHGRHVEARLEQGDHLVPGLEHLAAVDALDRQALEDHVVPVDRDLAAGDAEERDLAPVDDRAHDVAEGAGGA